MTDIKDLIIAKQEELLKELTDMIMLFQSGYNLIEIPHSISYRISKLNSELASLKAQIPDTTINPKELESLQYIKRMEELISLGDTINIKARFIHLKRMIMEDFAKFSLLKDTGSVATYNTPLASDTEEGKEIREDKDDEYRENVICR